MHAPMKKILRNTVRAFAAIAIVILISLAAFLVFATVTDFKPAATENVSVTAPASIQPTVPVGKIELYTWNIGYCGLGSKMDFFYEGGKMVRPSAEYYKQCRDGVIKQVKSFGQPGFVLLQEVDWQAARTYNDRQASKIEASMPGYASTFATNYKVPFVPVPPASPMGKVNSGILTLSQYQPVEATRYQFPSAYSWPKKLFMLDRCFLLTRYNVSNGKQLVVINTHNSAYADAVELRAKELNLLKNLFESEYAKGNYVIAGGDWNQNPVPYTPDSIRDGNIAYAITPGIPPDFLPEGFTWAYDPGYPTNRNVDTPYHKGKTPTTLIDFFVFSPNITLVKINTIQTGFEYADHQPVGMAVELK
jgi:endonuclease/exonuclease/phosphatase family metal-dependent hydrolase